MNATSLGIRLLALLRWQFAIVVALVLLWGLGFAIGALAGWIYATRDGVCAQVETPVGIVPVCDYGWRPPEGAIEQ